MPPVACPRRPSGTLPVPPVRRAPVPPAVRPLRRAVRTAHGAADLRPTSGPVTREGRQTSQPSGPSGPAPRLTCRALALWCVPPVGRLVARPDLAARPCPACRSPCGRPASGSSSANVRPTSGSTAPPVTFEGAQPFGPSLAADCGQQFAALGVGQSGQCRFEFRNRQPRRTFAL